MRRSYSSEQWGSFRPEISLGVLFVCPRRSTVDPSVSVHLPKTELIATLEALLIIVIDPRLNARREKFRNALPLFQSETDKPEDVEERLDSIDQKLELVLKLGTGQG